MAPSKSQANKAGKRLRNFDSRRPSDEVTNDEWSRIVDAFDIVTAWRAAHQYPLGKANMGLRSKVATAQCPSAKVTQRLKRTATIVDKLTREPNMSLSTMQDIGGCRVVFESIDQLRRVEKRIASSDVFVRSTDYITNPRGSGYRGVHAIVTYKDRDSTARFIEVQLRTKVMHDWAIAVENFSGRIGEDLKSGRGPKPVLDWLELVSEAMAIEESNAVVPEDFLSKIQAARDFAIPYLQGGRKND